MQGVRWPGALRRGGRASWLLALLLFCGGARETSAALISVGDRIPLTPTAFALPIEVSDAVEFAAWTFDLIYDPTDVLVDTTCDPLTGDPYCSLLTGPVTEGGFFASGAPFNLLLPGFIELHPVTLAQTGFLFGVHGAFGAGPPAPSGSGTLAFIRFALLGGGDSPIDVGGGGGATPVPEPGALLLLTTGLLLFGAVLRRRGRNPVGSLLAEAHMTARPNCSRHKSMRTRVRFQFPLSGVGRRRFGVACAILGVLAASDRATAQIFTPPVVDPPTTILQPPAGYPATVAPTAAGPYFARPAWGQALAPNMRFVVLSNMNSNAVLDRETALVWARRFVADSAEAGVDWFTASRACEGLIIGNRGGWRLPTVAELRTLLDYSLPETESPRFPAGHPFALVLTDEVGNRRAWSDSQSIGNILIETAGDIPQTDSATRRGQVDLRTGSISYLSILDNEPTGGALCVRGAQ